MRNSTGFTTGEVAAVLIVIIVIAALLFPILTTPPHEKSKQISCLSNLKQLGVGLFQYAQDNDNRLPPRQTIAPNGHILSWRFEINPYVKSTGIYQCPTNPAAKWADIERDGFPRSYAVNSSSGGLNNVGGPFNDAHPALMLAKIPSPATTIAVVESTSAFNDFNPLFPDAFAQPLRDGWRTGHLYCGHSGRTNTLLTDGHARSIKPLDTLTARSTRLDFGPAVNGWTIDGSPFTPADQATATSTLQYGIAMAKSDTQ